MTHSQNSFKRLSKLWIEDGVDDGVETGVDVAKKSCDVEGYVARGGVEVVLNTKSIKNVAGEERNPANQEGY